jgi:hypothetical protein
MQKDSRRSLEKYTHYYYNENMSKVDNGTLEQYFYNQYLLDGRYELPMVAKHHINLSRLKLIRFGSIIKNETKGLDTTVHFFEYDNWFDEILKTLGSCNSVPNDWSYLEVR